jgi:hypothetical protein
MVIGVVMVMGDGVVIFGVLGVNLPRIHLNQKYSFCVSGEVHSVSAALNWNKDETQLRQAQFRFSNIVPPLFGYD